MQKSILLLSLVAVVSALSFVNAQDPALNPPSVTFADLNKSDLGAGPFLIEGVVTDIYKCPPCPKGAQCKPCIGDHLTISDNPDEKDPALKRWLRVFATVPELEKVELTKTYSFVVKVRGVVREGKPIQDVELIRFVPLETKPKS